MERSEVLGARARRRSGPRNLGPSRAAGHRMNAPARMTTVEVIPSAKRMVLSLRDIGYDLPHAVADLIDNSIAAGATRVDVDLRFEGVDSWLRIADNGGGMAGAHLTEAMKYGTERDYGLQDLGKFGLGMKTASMSQCRRLSVASRVATQRARVEARILDLDHIERTDMWEILIPPAADRNQRLVSPLQQHTGTVVLWESLDRVLGYKLPWGQKARQGLLTIAEALDLHLGMVFHRFLAGEVPKQPRLVLTLNGTQIEPWDPFARSESSTIALSEREFDVESDDGRGLVRLQPFVLPPRQDFSSEQAFNRAGGPARWNRQQGFYIYRANRMVQSGGWSYTRTADEHTKLARAAIDFFPDLDTAFEINVSKARVNLPASLREQMKPAVNELVRQAQAVYRSGPDGASGSGSNSGRRGPGGRGKSGYDSTSGGGGTGGSRSTSVSPRKLLETAADRAGEAEALARIADELKKTEPGVAHELGW